MIYEIYSDQTGHWSEVSKGRYDDWDGEKRIIEIVKTEFGRANRPLSPSLQEIVASAAPGTFTIHDLGPHWFGVKVPASKVEAAKKACYENVPLTVKVDVLAFED